MKKRILSLTVITLLLAACSKNEDVTANNTVDITPQASTETVAPLQKSGAGIQGSWSFCHDKTLTADNVIESCTLYDNYVWQFENDGVTVGKVVSPLVKQNCTTQCYNASLSKVQVKNIANGYFTKEENAIIIDITDSTDLANFPTCQVKWNIIDKVDDKHQQWQLENLNCTNPIFNFKTWSKKI